MAATPPIRSATLAAESSFVGRAKERAAFTVAFDRMLEGRRQVLTLAGEPGIGKTRLAETLAEVAEGQGALVLWGRCYEEPGSPPYWPWVQIVREFAAASSPSEIRRMVGDGAEHIATLVPELKAELGVEEAKDDAPHEPGHARFGTFDAIARFLRRAADQVPLLLILDNAHWADKASLALLEFLTEALTKSHVLIICTYRDTEITRTNPLLATLGELSRASGIERLKLRGLDKPEIKILARHMVETDLPKNVIKAIDQQTDGNPLFVIELLKALIEESQEAGIEPIAVRIPDGVRETIGRRLSRLPDGVNELLRVASVIGRSFEGREVECISGIDIGTVLSALHLAGSAGFVETREEQPSSYRFTHALIRETLYDEIPTPDRLRLHGLTADALIAFDPEHERQRLSQIAHHYFESAALGNAEKAADFAARAGHEALRLNAYEEAVVQYSNVLSLLKQYGVGGAERVRETVFWKSRALCGCGDIDGAAALLVESMGDQDSVPHAKWMVDVVALWAVVRTDSVQAEQMPIVRRMLKLLPDGDSVERAKLLVVQAFAERSLGSNSRVRDLVEESLAMARRLGDVEIQCDCLRSAFYGLNGDPSTLELRLKLGDEFIRIAPAGNQNERSAEATYQQGLNLVEAGRIDELVRLLDAYEGLKASRIGLHEHRVKTLRVVVALLRGEYPGLEQRIRDLREVGRKTREQDADGVYGAQMFALSRDLGSLGELAPVIERFAASPANRAWTPGLLMALVEIDRVDAVKAHLERLAADRFAEIPKDDLRATSLAFCAEACAKLGDAECARQLYELLLPHSGTFLSHPTAVCFGAAELFLGMLAATMGELADARRAFETAIKANTAARAWPWVARSCYQYARALGQSEQQDDRARANELLREAGQLADSFGMKGLAADVDRLLRGHDAGEVYPDALTAREVDVLRLIAIGRSNKDIGKVLSISLNTVATHVRNILTKTDCANRTEAAAYASRNDLIESR